MDSSFWSLARASARNSWQQVCYNKSTGVIYASFVAHGSTWHLANQCGESPCQPNMSQAQIVSATQLPAAVATAESLCCLKRETIPFGNLVVWCCLPAFIFCTAKKVIRMLTTLAPWLPKERHIPRRPSGWLASTNHLGSWRNRS